MKKTKAALILLLLALFALTACSTEEQSAKAEEIVRPEGWTEESHGNDAEPNYEVVFPQDRVNQLTIAIDPDAWEAMQADMVELAGEPGTRGVGGFNGNGPPGGFAPPGGDGFAPPDGANPPEDALIPDGGEPPVDFAPPGGFGGREGPGGLLAENPMWVTATIEFNGQTWTNVGVRYKGNSSLMSSWNSGSQKLPLKLDFDEFEDEYPEIDNQRFYGFKQLSLANGFGDDAFMRETTTYDLLEEAGLPAAETAYYEIILDHGDGPVSLGLYVIVEVIDDTVVDRVFGNDDGNIYEADGSAASFAEGTYNQIEDSFQKENNEDESDWSDVEELYNILHDEERTTNPAAWREKLEAAFDVDGFLEWLALSAVLQHWDTYGGMTHNYYLYNDPESGRLTWISWDHNLVLGGLGNPGGRGGGPGGRSNVSLDKADVGQEWPLIRYLLDDPTYYEKYVAYLAEAAELFEPDAMAARYQELAVIIGPYAADEVGQETFETAVASLTTLTYERAQAVADFLDNQ